ncbi:MAG: exodeoxyribonuclease VII large subunit [Planctomycetes bacterium]|nr:exodeoxyribonuclease VII large subunit [Planctomycetota bacterium]
MTGSVELDPDGTNLLIRFPYREDLVALVKDLPGRRWDPKGKTWRVPATHVEKVFSVFSRHLFEFAPEISSLLAGTLRAEPPPSPKDGRERSQRTLPLPTPDGDAITTSPGPVEALSISALNRRVRDGMRQLFPDSFWVVGEIVDFDKTAGRQHRFFQLVEKLRGEARATAAVEVALFAGTAERVLPRLLASEPSLTLRDGIEVRVLVKVDLYIASGRYQVVVEDIDPSFTLGKLALTREQILRDLTQKGLADRNRSLGFPVPTLRIGVLASPDSDGWNDFLRHLEESRTGLAVTLLPIKVQGVEMKPSLLRGLEWFAQRAADHDVLCILRGGGSRTDLAWFDDRDVAHAVAKHPLKIVVGIGHQRDQTVLDAIAHSEKTPTAVAELLVRGVEDAREDVDARGARLRSAASERVHDHRDELDRLTRSLQRAITFRLVRHRGALAAAGREIEARARLFLQRQRFLLENAMSRGRDAARRSLDGAAATLDQRTTRLRLLDPRRVLGRGYALVRSADGRVLPSASRVAAGTAVQIQFRDGRASGRIDDVQQDPHE